MRRYTQIAAGLLAILLHQASLAQNDLNQNLVERGLFWQERGDAVRASEAWNRLLIVSPDNARALYGLATVALKADRIDDAREYLQRLKQHHPDSPLVAQLEQDILLSSPRNKALLEEAHQARASDEADLAVQKYREAFGAGVPVGSIGRDFYETMGYAPNGLAEAIKNLRRLHAQSPDDLTVELALARHLTRNEATRTEGIRLLSRLSRDKELSSSATENWRNALLWSGPPEPPAQPLFRDYLAEHPNDEEVRALLDKGLANAARVTSPQAATPPDPLRQRTNAAMKLVDAGNKSGISAARAEFEAVLVKRPNDSEALGGLGVLAMQEGKWHEALDYLTRARRGNAAWQPSLSTAQYWVDVEKAQSDYQSGQTEQARRLATQAARRAPNEVAANLLLADIMLDEGQTAQAVQAYRAILKRRPDDPMALMGLSRASRLSGDDPAARKLIDAALVKDPDNPWLRYELAQIDDGSGQAAQGRRLLEELRQSKPDDPDVLYVSALQASNNQQWAQTLTYLDRIAPAQRTSAMNQLYANANRRSQIAQAVSMGRAGEKAQAGAWLDQILAGDPGDFELKAAVARGYVDMGEPERGFALLRPLRAPGQARSVDASIAYSGLLLAAGQDLEASVMLRQLQESKLTVSQRKQVNELSDSYRVRQADLLTAKGEPGKGLEILTPVLAKRPNDLAAQGALARIYAASGEKEKATAVYKKLLESDPDNAELHLGLAQIAQQTGNDRLARQETEIAVELAPENIQVLTSAGRISRDAGRSGDAVKLLEKALALQTSNSVSPGSGNPGARENAAGGQSTNQTGATASAPTSELARDLEALYEQRSAQAIAGVEYRNRNGEAGTSQLTQYQVPMEVNVPVGNGRMSFRATFVSLNAGSIGSLPTYTGPAALLQYSPLGVKDETQSGVGLAVGYQTRGMEFDAGVTPLGFQQVNFTGGALFQGSLDSAGTLNYRLDISRRPVTDSVLSFAGRRYDALGLAWGGVTATGARFTLTKSFGSSGIYGSAAWHSLKGTNVASNQRTEVNIGTYFHLIDKADTRLTAGLNFNAAFFQKNLGYFTYGSGGYFSPQQSYALAIPLSWAQRSGAFSYRIDGAFGIQRIRQDQAPVFPNNPALQAFAEQSAGANNLFGNGFYPGQTKTGFSYNVRASGEYRLNPHLVLGATFGADNSENYREWMGGVYLRYYFYPQRQSLVDLPVVPYRSPYGITYGR